MRFTLFFFKFLSILGCETTYGYSMNNQESESYPNRAPLKDSRETCHRARDLYFECLDANKLVLNGLKAENHDDILQLDPLNTVALDSKKASRLDFKNGLFNCSDAERYFKQSCLPSWFKYFISLRIKQYQNDYIKEFLKSKEVKTDGDQEFWKRVSNNKL